MLQILKELGLTEKQALAYEELLKKEFLKASDLAKILGMSRAGIYDTLRVLINNGIVSEIYEGKIKVFRAANPTFLKNLVENKKEEIKKTETELDIFINSYLIKDLKKEKTKITVFSGKRGIKVVLEYIFEVCQKNDEVLAYGLGGTHFHNLLGGYYNEYIFRHIGEHKIKFRAILNKEEKKEKYVKELGKLPLVKARFNLTEYKYPTHTRIFGNCVAQFIFNKTPTVILIEDQALAESYKYFFEQLWKTADIKN